MGFGDKIKEFFKKLKEENKNFGLTMKRMNGTNFYGNVNRGIKSGDFWEGSYINLEGNSALIYSSTSDDYYFTADDIENVELRPDVKVDISVGQNKLAAMRCIIALKDGKVAQADIILEKYDNFKKALNF